MRTCDVDRPAGPQASPVPKRTWYSYSSEGRNTLIIRRQSGHSSFCIMLRKMGFLNSVSRPGSAWPFWGTSQLLGSARWVDLVTWTYIHAARHSHPIPPHRPGGWSPSWQLVPTSLGASWRPEIWGLQSMWSGPHGPKTWEPRTFDNRSPQQGEEIVQLQRGPGGVRWNTVPRIQPCSAMFSGQASRFLHQVVFLGS